MTLLQCPICGASGHPLHEKQVRTAVAMPDGSVRFLRMPVCGYCISRFAILIPDTVPLELLERELPPKLRAVQESS